MSVTLVSFPVEVPVKITPSALKKSAPSAISPTVKSDVIAWEL